MFLQTLVSTSGDFHNWKIYTFEATLYGIGSIRRKDEDVFHVECVQCSMSDTLLNTLIYSCSKATLMQGLMNGRGLH